jgi:hypothetical protein
MLLWYPWYDRTLDGLRAEASVPPPDALHAGYVEFIKGALTYHYSYRAAYMYPTRERLPLVRVPVLQLCAEYDRLRQFIPEALRLLPGSRSRIHQGTSTPERAAIAVDLWRRFTADEPLPSGVET